MFLFVFLKQAAAEWGEVKPLKRNYHPLNLLHSPDGRGRGGPGESVVYWRADVHPGGVGEGGSLGAHYPGRGDRGVVVVDGVSVSHDSFLLRFIFVRLL